MYIGTFNQFIFESGFGQDRLDFCLDLFSKYKREGKGMQDLPFDVQLCIKGAGQTDFSTETDRLYSKYLENGKSFDGIQDFDYDPADLAYESAIERLAKILKKYGKSIQYSLVDEETGEYQLVIASRGVTVNMIFDELSEIMDDQKLTYPTGEDYYSELTIFLKLDEVEELTSLLD